MAENERKNFMFYLSWLDNINEMEPDELKRFINNLCNYHLGLDLELITKDDRKNWNFVKPALVINDKKWKAKVESSRRNGQLGGAPVGNQNARRTETTQDNPNNLLIDNSKKLIDNSKMITVNSKLVNDNSEMGIDNRQVSIVDCKLEKDNMELKNDFDVIPEIDASIIKSNKDSIARIISSGEKFDLSKYENYVEELLSIKEKQHQSSSSLDSKETYSKLISSMHPDVEDQINILRYILQTKNYSKELVNIIWYYSQNFPVELKKLFDQYLGSMAVLLKKDLAILNNNQFAQICSTRGIQLRDYLA